eukprot:6629401-Prymnesium_polylepis.1
MASAQQGANRKSRRAVRTSLVDYETSNVTRTYVNVSFRLRHVPFVSVVVCTVHVPRAYSRMLNGFRAAMCYSNIQ